MYAFHTNNHGGLIPAFLSCGVALVALAEAALADRLAKRPPTLPTVGTQKPEL